MAYILKKHASALNIRVGKTAREHLLKNGLYARDVDIVPGAAGGPKGLGLQGLDQAIFGEFFPQAPQRRTLIGSSIGSWRFASICAWGAKQGTERLADLYTHLYFDKKMNRQQIGEICRNMLLELVGSQQQQLIQHPDYHLTVLSVQAQHVFKSDRQLALLASIAGIVGGNVLGRKHNRWFMQRVVSQPKHAQQIHIPQDDFITHYHHLTSQNVLDWLMASASIPMVMSAVQNIADAPQGSYRDGGLIDYHLDLPFQSQGIVLYPHFTDQIIPGWFDKMLKRTADPERHTRTVLISPSAAYLASLPLGRLPDRKDFSLKGLSHEQRIQLWQQSIAESQRLGDEFLELIEKQHWSSLMQDL